MSFFLAAITHLLDVEGGFVHDPKDPGGATNYGITQATLSAWRSKPCSPVDVCVLSRSEARVIYQETYWKPIGGSLLTNSAIATAMLDAAVLFGIGVASLYAQKAASECRYPELRLDGHIGPKTIEVLNKIDPKAFLEAFRLQFVKRIAEVIARRPTSERYRHGWEERVAKYPLLVS